MTRAADPDRMPLIHYLASDLAPTTPAEVAPALPRDRFRVQVAVTGPACGPPTDALKTAGVDVRHLPVRHPTDAGGFAALRSAVAWSNADVLHALDPAAARLAYLLTRPRIGMPVPPRVIVSGADHPGGGPAGWLTRRALRTADRVVARTHAEAAGYARLGVPPDRVEVVPPGVSPAPPPPDPAAFRRSLGIPEAARLVVAAGRFDAAAGLRSAVWAFDVVKYVAPDLYLVLVGDGPERGRLEQFARALGFDDYRVRFAGPPADPAAAFGLAEVVWVTHVRGGVGLALAAMAAGKPVVAAHTPELAEVVEDGATGRLVPPTDRVRLAAVTNELLEDPGTARRLGEAGRGRAAERFPVREMAERYARLYDALARD